MSEWQPIDTCPRGVRVIFGWDGLQSAEFGSILPAVRNLPEEFSGWNGCEDDAPPTHWMHEPGAPLPEPITTFRGKQGMSRNEPKLDWWREMLAEQMDQHGIAATAEQIALLAIDIYDCADSSDMAFPGAAAAGPYTGPTDSERLQEELKKERSKITCTECRGTGEIVIEFGPLGRISRSQCSRCCGNGRHLP